MSFEYNLDLLKKNVLIKAGISGLTPSDCKKLSLMISRSVGKNISETTLKRLYGFANVKHNFSKFTITALCEFIGKENWEKFSAAATDVPDHSLLDKWDELKNISRNISRNTIKAVSNRSGIPFNYTVPREFAERDFEEFYSSDYYFTGFISPPGFGKSILLCHLLNKMFLAPEAPYENDMLWFVTPSTLPSSDFFNINEWLCEQMGGGMSFIEYFKQKPQHLKGKVFIVLDGFDGLLSKKDSKSQLSYFTDFICLLEGISWIKLIFSMRSISWADFNENIRRSAFLKSKWFPGNYFDISDFTNVPHFTDKEICSILGSLPQIDSNRITPKLKSQFRFPFYIQVFYQLIIENEEFNYQADLTFYELINAFVHQKINLSPHYTEKILLLKKIIALAQNGLKINQVHKEDLLADINNFKDAYEELLLDGILVEEKHMGMMMPKEVIRFIHQHIFEYFLFIEIIDENKRVINLDVFQYINEQFDGLPVKSQLLKWAIRHAVYNHDGDALIDILQLDLPEDERNYLLLAVVETIEYKGVYKKNLHQKVLNEHLHKAILDILLRFDILGPCYKKILKVLKKITIQSDFLIIYSSLLAYIAVQELNKEELAGEIDDMKAVPYCKEKWLFQPCEIFDPILSRLSSKPGGDFPILAKIAKFKQEPCKTKHSQKELSPEVLVSYVMAFAVSFFFSNSEENALIYNAIKTMHPKILLRRNSLSVFLLNFCALTSLRNNEDINLEKLMALLEKAENRRKQMYPEHFNLLFLMIKVEYHLAKSDYQKAKEQAEKCMMICDSKGIGLLYVVVMNSLVKIYKNLGETDKEEEALFNMYSYLDKKAISINHFSQSKKNSNSLAFFKLN